MVKTQLNVRVDEETAETARLRASERGISVNRYIEELVREDHGENGRTFVEAAADFMKRYESVFAEEFGREREGSRSATSAAGPRSQVGRSRTASGEPSSPGTDATASTVVDSRARAGARRPGSGRPAGGTAKGTGTAA